ncbi:periplasmic binding protein-like I [Entophlyctis helioformis]|nr:periplasmic binding protein-like I [Entophlyctis helioformis]
MAPVSRQHHRPAAWRDRPACRQSIQRHHCRSHHHDASAAGQRCHWHYRLRFQQCDKVGECLAPVSCDCRVCVCVCVCDCRVCMRRCSTSDVHPWQTTLLTEAKRVPQCDGASTNPDLSDNTTYPFFFRTAPSDNFQTAAIRDFVLSMGWRRVAIIGQTDAYGTGILKAFQDAVAGSPLKIISVQNAVSQQGIIPDGSYNASSWEAYLDNIRDSNVFVVLVLAIAQQVEGLFEAAAKRGMMSSKYVWIGSDGMQSVPFSSRVPGFMITLPVEGNGPAYDFVNSLASKRLREIDATEEMPAFHTRHAACMELLLRGFDRFLKTTPGTSITDLAAGRLNRLLPNPAILFNFPDVFTPTGKVNLDPFTGDPTSSYNIFSIQGDQRRFVPVAQWDAQTRQVTITRRILYGTDESTVTPADDIVVADYTAIVRLRDGHGASAIALNLIAMLLITATAAFFALHRHNPIIRKSSIPNMHMMLVGLLLRALTCSRWLGYQQPCIASQTSG